MQNSCLGLITEACEGNTYAMSWEKRKTHESIQFDGNFVDLSWW